MTTESNLNEKEYHRTKVIRQTTGASEAVYGLGLIGAWVYFLSHATTFWLVVLGLLKGIVWPALLVYQLMKFLGM